MGNESSLRRIRAHLKSGKKNKAWKEMNAYLAEHPESEEAWVLALEFYKNPGRQIRLITKGLRYLPNSRKLTKMLTDSRIARKQLWEDSLQNSNNQEKKLYRKRMTLMILWGFCFIGVSVAFISFIDAYQRVLPNWLLAIVFVCFSVPLIYSGVAAKWNADQADFLKTGKRKTPEWSPSFKYENSRQQLASVTSCKSCGHSVSIQAPTCPNCGVEFPGLKVRCPKCGSFNTAILGNPSFSFGKSLTGGVLFGPVGFLAGYLGEKGIIAKCNSCGLKWKISEENIVSD